jgi:hypothetical protein
MNDDDRCPGTNRNGERCGHPAGWGTDNDDGPCKHHGGAGGDVGDPGGAPSGHNNSVGNDGGPPEGSKNAEGDGAPKNNTNAVTHGMYRNRNAYYSDRSDEQQALIDSIYEDYRAEYERRRGHEPLTGDDVKLFGIAVGIHKTEFRADDWADDRPDELNSGHELVDRSEKRTAQGEPYYEYKPAAVLQGEKQVSQEVRMWLDKLGLLQPPDDSAEINVNIHDAMLKGLKEVYED